MKVLECYNCKGAEQEFYDRENGFSLVKCKACGLIYLLNQPDEAEISEAHKQGVHKGTKQLSHTGYFDNSKVKAYGSILKQLYPDSLDHIRSWLDVGCGHGEFLIALGQYINHEVTLIGSEPNEYKSKSARARGLNVSFIDLVQHESKYDCISLLNVWSHLPKPAETIEQLKSLLTEKGELLLETGDTAHFPAHQHFKPYYLPDHLSFASEKIVTQMLLRHGFRIISIRKFPCIRLSAKNVLKEFVKLFLPERRSGLRHLIHSKRYATDMYVRAQLIAK